MQVLRLEEDLKFVNQIGRTLNLEQRMNLILALQKLNESQKLESLEFWGKIEGIDDDYYIARGLTFKGQSPFPKKIFFWATSKFNFSVLPETNNEYKISALKLRKPFNGQHEQILPTDESEQKPQNQGNFTELMRLSWTVYSIEHDCQLVPFGAIKALPTNELCYNETFKGLNCQEAQLIVNYGHFRKQETNEKLKLVERGDSLFRSDFLDPIEEDLPHGQWSIQTDSSQTQVTIRNLLWPGYIAYHRTNSAIFGAAYFGNGIKNIDLPFLL